MWRHINHRRKTGRDPIHLLNERRQAVELLPAKPSLVHLYLSIEHGRNHARLRAQDVPVFVVGAGRQFEDFGGFVERLIRQPFELGAVVENSRLVAYPIRCSSGSWRRKRRPISVRHMGEFGKLSLSRRR